MKTVLRPLPGTRRQRAGTGPPDLEPLVLRALTAEDRSLNPADLLLRHSVWARLRLDHQRLDDAYDEQLLVHRDPAVLVDDDESAAVRRLHRIAGYPNARQAHAPPHTASVAGPAGG